MVRWGEGGGGNYNSYGVVAVASRWLGVEQVRDGDVGEGDGSSR